MGRDETFSQRNKTTKRAEMGWTKFEKGWASNIGGCHKTVFRNPLPTMILL